MFRIRSVMYCVQTHQGMVYSDLLCETVCVHVCVCSEAWD